MSTAKPVDPARYIVYGAGAIGGVLGAQLFEHGHDVVLIARGAHGDAIARDGLQVTSPTGSRIVRLPAVAHPGEIDFRDGDVALLAMKSQDTEAAVEVLTSVAPPEIPIVCAQNGVENERIAARRFSNVYGACVVCPSSHLASGSVVLYSTPIAGTFDLGRYPSGVDATAEGVATAISSAGCVSVARADIMAWKYSKLLMNLNNAVEALLGAEDAGKVVTKLARAEGIACLRSAGIDFIPEHSLRTYFDRRLTRLPVDGQNRGGGSSWQSMKRGTGRIESDFLNGEVCLLGRLYDVPTPVNATLQRLAREFSSQGMEPGALSEEDILAVVSNGDTRQIKSANRLPAA